MKCEAGSGLDELPAWLLQGCDAGLIPEQAFLRLLPVHKADAGAAKRFMSEAKPGSDLAMRASSSSPSSSTVRRSTEMQLRDSSDFDQVFPPRKA